MRPCISPKLWCWIKSKNGCKKRLPSREGVPFLRFPGDFSGSVLMKVHGIAPLGMVHKIGAALFLVLLLVLYIPKCKK